MRRLPPPNGEPRVLFAGRFEARKGPDVLLQAVPRLVERVPDARVVLLGTDSGVAGDGTYSAGLRNLISELGIEDATEIIERWGRDAVAEELTRTTVCVVPSRWESFGYVAAEAAAAGRPVVGSRITALEDVVTDGVTGRLVPVDSPEPLSDALADLLSKPSTAKRMGAAAAEDIAERCDPDRIAAATLSAYELAIDRWRRRG
jgi:glycosyltransferase involved in cell wall biosynthesis